PRLSGMRFVPLLALATACAGPGAMHQATLMGQCSADDAACSRRHPFAPIAIGARFHPDVSTDIAGSTTPNLHLESAAPDVLAVSVLRDGSADRRRLRARAPGKATLTVALGELRTSLDVEVVP